MNIAFMANGHIENYTWLEKELTQYDRKIAVDGGLHHFDTLNLKPDAIYGDLDSVDKSLLHRFSDIPQNIFPTDKDKTDLHLAIEKENQKDSEMTIFAGLGYRIDHSLGNIELLALYKENLRIKTPKETLFVINHSCHLRCLLGQTLSLLPLGTVEGITTKGLKWELNHHNMDKTFYGISNICLKEDIMIDVERGDLLCCIVNLS